MVVVAPAIQYGLRNTSSAVLVAAVCLAISSGLPVTAEQIIRAEDIVRQVIPPPRNVTRGIQVESSQPSPIFRKISLPTIQFEFASARLTADGQRQLDEVAKALNSNALSLFFFAIQGHTDGVGSKSYNKHLSERRASAVKDSLSSRRISSERLVEVGLGENFPLPGISVDDARNRRVEIVNLGMNHPILPHAEKKKPAGARRALLIGIDDYWNNISPLSGPVNDVVQMARFLREEMDYEEHEIKTLLDGQATRERILESIKSWLIAGTAPGDEVFMFFSGHGFQQPDGNGDEDDRYDETLVPVDASVDNARKTVHGMISDDEVKSLLDQLEGRRINVVIDSCHSGTITRDISDWKYVKTPRLADGTPLRVAPAQVKVAPAQGRKIKSLRPESFLASDRPDMLVWTAVKADQKALVDQEVEEASVFTRRFLSGIKGKKADWDGDGIVTVRELHRYVLVESSEYCRRHPGVCAQGLTPQLYAPQRQLDRSVFWRGGGSLPRTASLAKDILVQGKPGGREANKPEDVRLRMNPGGKVQLGEEIQVTVESERGGRLVLLDIDAAGRLTQIFPNEISIRSGVPEQIRAGDSVILPGDKKEFLFKMAPPVGAGMLIAIVSESDVRLQEMLSRHKDLSVVPRPQAYLVELSETLRNGGSIESNERFATTKLEYEIFE